MKVSRFLQQDISNTLAALEVDDRPGGRERRHPSAGRALSRPAGRAGAVDSKEEISTASCALCFFLAREE